MARILIVDDEEAVLRATRILLEAKGFDVVTVCNGESAVEAVKGQSFDVAIVDLFLPGMDGLKTTETIRAINPSLPVIAASGFMFNRAFGGTRPDMPQFDEMAKQAGAFATLYKPFRPADLLCALKAAMAATVKNPVA
jgi:CheY-like chemotaxis protein